MKHRSSILDYESAMSIRASRVRRARIISLASLAWAGGLTLLGLVMYGIADERGKQDELSAHMLIVAIGGALGTLLALVGIVGGGRDGWLWGSVGMVLNVAVAIVLFLAIAMLA